jgi:metal-dependent hydrolase (beta-lactamase superfamily II)
MVLIHNTNIIVDDFTQRNKNPWSKYIYFLTHMHADHYKGLMAQWNYGTIYCSELSKSILLNLFPGVGDIRSLPLNTPTSIFLDEKYFFKIQNFLKILILI